MRLGDTASEGTPNCLEFIQVRESNPPMIGTSNNVERTGNRNDLAVSSFLRTVEKVRHIDIDFIQYDPVTEEPEVCVEATSAKYKKTNLLQKWSQQLDAFAILVKHDYHDHDHRYPIKLKVWDNKGVLIADEYETTWDDLKQWCEDIHEAYEESRK